MKNGHDNGYKAGQKGAWIGILSNIFLFVLKLYAGIAGRSQAMLADAFHTASDFLTSVGVLVGFKIAEKPPDDHHPLGHGRAESIMAKLVSIVLILVGVRIAYGSAKILASGSMTEPGMIALVMAVVSIVVKEITYRYVIATGRRINSASLKADAYHHRSDALSSVAALIGIAAAMAGKTFMDPLAGIIVAGFIIKMGGDAFHTAYDELMDAAPPREFKKKIEDVILGVEGVREVKEVVVRKAGIDFYIETTIGVDGAETVEQGHLVTVKIKRDLLKTVPNIKHVTVHVEPSRKSG
jgi:cation diffusion facilitator family transporter